jgi:hypothetical protein
MSETPILELAEKIVDPHVDFAYSRSEEMLWIPDAVAGAVSMARQGRETHVRLAFGELIGEIDVDLI